MASHPRSGEFSPAPFVILVADLSGYHRGFRTSSDADMARFLDRFYRLAEDVIGAAGGRIIKFMGDAVLAVFGEEDAAVAVATAVSLEVYSAALARDAGLDMRLGANLHAGPAILAELGHGSSRRLDVIGRSVNQTFLLGRGAGIRISERVYRRLPSSDRAPWDKNKPPAVYVLGEGAEPYESLRMTAADDAVRG